MNTTIKTLKEVSIFAPLNNVQLGWLVNRGCEVWLSSGEYLKVEGDLPGNFYVLLEGEVNFTKKVGLSEKYVMTFGPGTFVGHELILLDSPCFASVQAIKDSHVVFWDNDTFWQILRRFPSITRELLTATAQRVELLEAVSGHHGKLVALGTLAAGLAHELNNPAAALSRGSKQLNQLFKEISGLSLRLTQLHLNKPQLEFLNDFISNTIEKAENTPILLDSLIKSDREEEMIKWLEANGINNGWRIAPTLVEKDLDTDWLDRMAQKIPVHQLGEMICWAEQILTGIGLLDQITKSSIQISNLVGTVKDYSYMDRAPVQDIDLHQAIESTLTILSYKIKGGISVKRQYDPKLPTIRGLGGELNQVWTNIIDNAIQAMDNKGEITIRTACEGSCILVEIADNGPGIPADIKDRIFEPFFSTKDVGAGMGMGLMNTYNIVVEKHKGDIKVFSQPGETRFQVRLPTDSLVAFNERTRSPLSLDLATPKPLNAMNTILKPPILRLVNTAKNAENEHRSATWLELFFDLTFVAAVTEVSKALSENFSLLGFLGFSLLFVPVWWSWLNATYYSDLFDTDDVIHRCLVAVSMIIVAALAMNLPHALDTTSRGFALSYIAMRVLLIAVFLRAGWHIKLARPLAIRVAQSFGLSALLWLLSTAVPAPARFFIWMVALSIEIGMAVTAGEAVHVELAPNESHLPERVGLFTIIVLGESVLAVVDGASEQQWSVNLMATAVLCFTIAFSLWWVYFDNLGGSAIQAARTCRSVSAYQSWLYAHLPLNLGLAATGVCVHHILAKTPGSSLAIIDRWLLCFSIAICFISLAVINLAGLSQKAGLWCKVRAFRRLGAAVAIAMLGLLGYNFTALETVSCITIICVLQVVLDVKQGLRT
jgi:low temperature requirement protein LtrA/signal transduction histidine kinase